MTLHPNLWSLRSGAVALLVALLTGSLAGCLAEDNRPFPVDQAPAAQQAPDSASAEPVSHDQLPGPSDNWSSPAPQTAKSQRPPKPARSQREPPQHSPADAPAMDLAMHEKAGGHTLGRHVGKTDAQLAARLAAEPNITASSSFTDRATAERATAAALEANAADIATWLAGNQRRMPVIEANVGFVVGRSLRRGRRSAVDVKSVRIVLERAPYLPTGYKIVTSYPTS